ncbi:MAG: hypothetical protein ACR2MT_15940 [Aurantibacter sp.]
MKTKFLTSMLVLALLFSVSCTKDDNNTDPDAVTIPPYETMALDFSDFMDDNSNSGKAALTAKPGDHWVYSRIVVGVWNTALFTTLAIPVASFRTAFNHSPEFLGDNVWQWSYTVDGFASQYTAKLTGELVGEEIHWKMYVSKTGTDPFEEFLWFTGVSKKDARSGHWVLNQSSDRQHAMLRIDWERENDEVAGIRYSWVREKRDDDSADTFKDSYLEYGLQEGDYNVFYNIHAFDDNLDSFSDVNIEWNRTAFYGRVRAAQYYNDEEWRCWDETGEDATCE